MSDIVENVSDEFAPVAGAVVTGYQWSPVTLKYICKYEFPRNLDKDAIHLAPFTTLVQPPEIDGKWPSMIDGEWAMLDLPIEDASEENAA